MYTIVQSKNKKLWYVFKFNSIVKVFHTRKEAVIWVNKNSSLFGIEDE